MSRALLSAFAVTCAAAALAAADAGAALEAAGRLAYGSDQSETWWSRHLDDTGKRRFLYRARDVSFSADGRRLAYVRLSPMEWAGVGVANGHGGFPAWVIRPFDTRIPFMTDTYEVALSPDGTQVAAEIQTQPDMDAPGGGWEVGVYLVAADGSNLRLVAADAAYPAWLPDGGHVAYLTSDSAVEAVAPDGTGKRTLLPAAADRHVRHGLEVSPDGRRLLFREYDRRRKLSRIVIADLATGAVTRLPARVTRHVDYAVWCQNGRRIAFSGSGTMTLHTDWELSRNVYTIRPNGTGKRLAFTVSGRTASIIGLAWQPAP